MQFKFPLEKRLGALKLPSGSWQSISQHYQLPQRSTFQVTAAVSATPAVTCSALVLLIALLRPWFSEGGSWFHFHVHFPFKFYLAWLGRCAQNLKAHLMAWHGEGEYHRKNEMLPTTHPKMKGGQSFQEQKSSWSLIHSVFVPPSGCLQCWLKWDSAQNIQRIEQTCRKTGTETHLRTYWDCVSLVYLEQEMKLNSRGVGRGAKKKQLWSS